MRSTRAFIKAIRRDPQKRITVLVFADWLQEYEGLSRFEALRTATAYRVREIQRRAMLAATRIMQPTNPQGDMVRQLIRSRFVRSYQREYLLCVVAEGCIPRARMNPYTSRPDTSFRLSITIPARWILRRVAEFCAPVASDAALHGMPLSH